MGEIVTVDNLNDVMEFDRVIRVLADGTVETRVQNMRAPEVYMHFRDEESSRKPDIAAPWQLMNGYSGQDRYSGPIMHESEFIGGGMARDILGQPGWYVAVIVTDVSAEAAQEEADGVPDSDIAGWAVAYQVDDAAEQHQECTPDGCAHADR
jgi:hypothetical protein